MVRICFDDARPAKHPCSTIRHRHAIRMMYLSSHQALLSEGAASPGKRKAKSAEQQKEPFLT